VKIECVFAIFLLIINLITLSIFIMTNKVNAIIKVPCQIYPFKSIIIAAGSVTIGAPITGIKDKKYYNSPKNRICYT
jgi:uncharacterized integral membrane protein